MHKSTAEISHDRREKLRWHCRRALLELDLIFEKFWQQTESLDERTASALEQLLQMEDHDLWDLLSGRIPVNNLDAVSQNLIQRLQSSTTP